MASERRSLEKKGKSGATGRGSTGTGAGTGAAGRSTPGSGAGATGRSAPGSGAGGTGSIRPASRVNPQVRRALHGEAVRHEPLLAFGRTNYLLMGGGILSAAAGFLLLWRGDITLAPILLVVGYCGLIPLGIELSRRRSARSPGPKRGANSSAG